MTTSVYISNEYLTVLTGKSNAKRIVVKDFVREPVEEGSILNGVITNEFVLKRTIENVWKKYKLPDKNIHLIVDGASVSTKLLNAPQVNETKMLSFIKGEFADVEETDSVVFDYTVITPKNENGGADILACLVEKEFLKGYVDLFESCKIDVEKIDISLACSVKLASFLSFLKKTTCVITVFDKNSVAQILFVNGKYRFSKSVRMVAERGSNELYEELARSLSSMIQFNKSEKNGFDITHFYFCGLTTKEEGFCPRLSDALGVRAETLPSSASVVFRNGKSIPDLAKRPRTSDYFYSLGNLLEFK